LEKIRVPSKLFDEWENSYREYLKQTYADDRRIPMSDRTEIRENFIYKGCIFVCVGEELKRRAYVS
jgi:hypothetical protein